MQEFHIKWIKCLHPQPARQASWRMEPAKWTWQSLIEHDRAVDRGLTESLDFHERNLSEWQLKANSKQTETESAPVVASACRFSLASGICTRMLPMAPWNTRNSPDQYPEKMKRCNQTDRNKADASILSASALELFLKRIVKRPVAALYLQTLDVFRICRDRTQRTLASSPTPNVVSCRTSESQNEPNSKPMSQICRTNRGNQNQSLLCTIRFFQNAQSHSIFSPSSWSQTQLKPQILITTWQNLWQNTTKPTNFHDDERHDVFRTSVLGAGSTGCRCPVWSRLWSICRAKSCKKTWGLCGWPFWTENLSRLRNPMIQTLNNYHSEYGERERQEGVNGWTTWTQKDEQSHYVSKRDNDFCTWVHFQWGIANIPALCPAWVLYSEAAWKQENVSVPEARAKLCSSKKKHVTSPATTACNIMYLLYLQSKESKLLVKLVVKLVVKLEWSASHLWIRPSAST